MQTQFSYTSSFHLSDIRLIKINRIINFQLHKFYRRQMCSDIPMLRRVTSPLDVSFMLRIFVLRVLAACHSLQLIVSRDSMVDVVFPVRQTPTIRRQIRWTWLGRAQVPLVVVRSMSPDLWVVPKVLQSYRKAHCSNLLNRRRLCLQWVYLLRRLVCSLKSFDMS